MNVRTSMLMAKNNMNFIQFTPKLSFVFCATGKCENVEREQIGTHLPCFPFFFAWLFVLVQIESGRSNVMVAFFSLTRSLSFRSFSLQFLTVVQRVFENQ